MSGQQAINWFLVIPEPFLDPTRPWQFFLLNHTGTLSFLALAIKTRKMGCEQSGMI